MLDRLFGYQAKRLRYLKKAPPGVLRDFLATPFPEPATPIDQVPILAVDFETTGLEPAHDQILSIGHIAIENYEIRLATAWHRIIQTQGKLSEQSVVIHQITDDVKEQGESLKAVVENLLQALAGKVMLVHFGRIETTFLENACLSLYGARPVFPVIDTLMLAKRRLERRDIPFDPSELRLFNLRERHQLPRYAAHNALIDALATAELLFAEIEKMNLKKPPLLKNLIS